jgi:hypothetical protein
MFLDSEASKQASIPHKTNDEKEKLKIRKDKKRGEDD